MYVNYLQYKCKKITHYIDMLFDNVYYIFVRGYCYAY